MPRSAPVRGGHVRPPSHGPPTANQPTVPTDLPPLVLAMYMSSLPSQLASLRNLQTRACKGQHPRPGIELDEQEPPRPVVTGALVIAGAACTYCLYRPLTLPSHAQSADGVAVLALNCLAKDAHQRSQFTMSSVRDQPVGNPPVCATTDPGQLVNVVPVPAMQEAEGTFGSTA